MPQGFWDSRTLNLFQKVLSGTLLVQVLLVIYYSDNAQHRKKEKLLVKAKPSSAISIVETDCEVDFAPPLDYQERELERMVKRIRIEDDK